jgi:methionyl-tRNA formyltransferase
LKVILCGFNWTGCKALDILLENGCEVFVYTHKSQYYVCNLEEYCKKKGVSFTTERISVKNIPFIPDVISSVYYRYIISKDIIDYCDGKIFNLHPSLLPDYKGCSSLTWAMIEGEEYVGYSYHYLTQEVDGGDILLQEKLKVEEFDTQSSLYNRVMFEAMRPYFKVVQAVKNKEKGTLQDNNKGKVYKRGAPFNGVIDPTWNISRIDKFIRAMIFPPLPAASFKDIEIYDIETYEKIRDSLTANVSNTLADNN